MRRILNLNDAAEKAGVAGRDITELLANLDSDALPEGGVEDRLVLVDFHLDVDGHEGDFVCVGHGFSCSQEREPTAECA